MAKLKILRWTEYAARIEYRTNFIWKSTFKFLSDKATGN